MCPAFRIPKAPSSIRSASGERQPPGHKKEKCDEIPLPCNILRTPCCPLPYSDAIRRTTPNAPRRTSRYAPETDVTALPQRSMQYVTPSETKRRIRNGENIAGTVQPQSGRLQANPQSIPSELFLAPVIPTWIFPERNDSRTGRKGVFTHRYLKSRKA